MKVGFWHRIGGRREAYKEKLLGKLNYPPDWGEHTMSLRPGDLAELQPDMTLHLIPGIWLEDWGIEISEAFRVTETGGETLCAFPRQLFVKD